MKKKIILLLILCFVAASGYSGDLNIQYISSINNGLFAPTSIAVTNDEIAVLEPFSKQIKIFSTDGFLHHKINLTGDAIGLAKIDNGLYAYCDRETKKVILADVINDSQSNYLEQLTTLVDPIDLIKTSEMLFILDAESKQIVSYNYSDGAASSISLVDNDNQAMAFPSTFDINPITKSFYVLDQTTCVIWTFNSQGVFQKKIGSFGGGEDQISRGGEIAVDNQGNIFVSDRYQNRVVIYDNEGNHVGNVDVTTTNSGGFNIPTGLDIDENGLLFVSSIEGSDIKIFHVEQAASENNYLAQYLYPLLNDTVSVNSVELSAVVEIFSEAEVVNGFDFQLYHQDTTQLFEEVNQIKPYLTDNNNSGNFYYKADWALDVTLDNDQIYIWRTRVTVNNLDGQWSDFQSFRSSSLPFSFELYQNYPNPFNPETIISFDIASKTNVRLEIYNVIGQLIEVVVDRELEAGHYEEIWSVTNQQVASGLYFYKLTTGENQKTRKMVLLK